MLRQSEPRALSAAARRLTPEPELVFYSVAIGDWPGVTGSLRAPQPTPCCRGGGSKSFGVN